MLHANWHDYYAARADNNLGNRDTSIYTEAWSPDKNDDVRFQTLISDINNVIFAADHDKNILVLHSFKVAGGSLLHPTTKLMCLLGAGSNAAVFTIDKNSILTPCDLITPTIDELMGCSNEEEVNAIAAPTGGVVTYPGGSTFLPAPWLRDTVMSSGTSNHAKLIAAVNAAANEFDAEHDGDANFVTTAEDHAADFILWAWGAGNGQTTAARMSFDPNDPDLEQFKIERHQQCITQIWTGNMPGGLPPAPAAAAPADLNGFFAPLLATVSRQVDAQEVQNNILTTHVEHMIDKSEVAKNRVKSLHDATLKMLLFASAMDNEDVPTDLTDSCKRIINSKTVALAEQELNMQFESRGMNMVSFPPGYTSNMYNGLLLWSCMDTPSNHSPFTFREAEPIKMAEQINRHLTLQLILTQGRGMTVDEIKASNKQEVNAPMSFSEMTLQLEMFTIANDIFLGELSVGSQCLRALQTSIMSNRSVFRAREIADEQFYSKFLFAVDSRFQIWLKDCRNAKNRNEVNDNTIDFSPIISQILYGCFNYNLPPTFKMKDPAAEAAAAAASAPANSDKKGGNSNEEEGRKKKKKDENQTMVKNEAPHPELCMLATETWAINFASKHIDKRPKWNETSRCCPRWFLQKYCFSDCKNKESHVKADEIPAENLTTMKAWIKLCRGGN